MNSESLSNNILNVTTLSLNKNKIKNVEHKTNLQSHTKTMKREPQKIIQHRKLSKKPNITWNIYTNYYYIP